MIYLTDNPNDISKKHLIYIVSDQVADTLIWLNYQKYHDIYKLNHVLTRSIQQLNPQYKPIEAHNYAKIKDYSRTSCNQIIGFNMTVYEYEYFKHEPIYLIHKGGNN